VSPALKESKKISRKVGVNRLKAFIGTGAMGKVYEINLDSDGEELRSTLFISPRATSVELSDLESKKTELL
jgi:hypothetical protein